MKERTNRTRELQRWDGGPSATSVHFNCRTHTTDEDCDAHMQDAEDAASPRFLLHSPTTSDEERATAAAQAQPQAGDGVASSAMAGSDREVTRSTALHLHLHPHHQLHDHHLHNLQLHHHHHGGHLNLAPQSPDGGVSDESGDESDRATADASSGSDNDDDADARHHRGDDDDNDRDVDDDSDDDDDVNEADGRLHHRRHTTATATAVASSATLSSSRRDSPSLLPLPPPTTTTTTSTSTSSSSSYGASMCYGTTPLRLMGPRFADVPPWLRDSAERKDDLPSLHDEIISFCKWVSPSAEEKQMREDVIARISKVVETLWPSVQLRVFGSCATDIYLPTSDIDLCIMGANACSPSPIDELASALRRRSMGRVQAIATARVPIIKLVDATTGCLVDISFDVPTGPAHINLIKRYLDEEPAVKPLALLIKYYLKQFGMNEPYTGGLGSYALIIMIISYLQLHKPRAVEKQQDLGVLFLGFLKLYGQEFNYFRTGLSIRDGGYYFPKAQRNWVDWQQPWLLSAEDPCFPENDISRMSYAIMDVRGCLANAYKVLISKEPSYSAPSLLCRILLQDEKMMEQRDFVRHHYRCGLPILPHLATATATASSTHAAHRHPPAVSWRSSDKSSKSRPPATTTYAAKSASASGIDSVVVERRAGPASATQQPQQAKPQQPRTGDWVSLVMKNAGSNGPAGARASKGGKPQHGGNRAHGDSASSREGDDKEDLTWRRNPPGTKPAPSSSSSRSSNSSSSSRSSATAARRSGSGRWERSSSSSNGDRRDRRVAQPASSSSAASSSAAASRGRGAVRQKGASGGADASTSKRASDEAATVPRRRSSTRRPNPASASSVSTAAAVSPATTATLEPRKRSRAADSPMEAIINNILIANQHHNNSDHTSSVALATPNLINVGSDNGDHEGADANGQRNKARNQKQKR